ERALGEPGPAGDLRHRGLLEPALGVQVQRGLGEAFTGVGLPAAHRGEMILMTVADISARVMSVTDIVPGPSPELQRDGPCGQLAPWRFLMRVFVTGASGWIGSAVVSELIDAGHEVAGLARSDASAAAVEDAGAEVVRGSLDNPDTLSAAAAAADGVVHTAYVHDFSQMEAAAATDRRVIEALGAALEGSGRPLVVTTGTGVLQPGRPVT